MENVYEELNNYTGYKIKLNSLQNRLKNREYELQNGNILTESDIDIIESLNFRNIDYTSQIHGKGFIKNKTEDIALKYKNIIFFKINKDKVIHEIKQLKHEIFYLEQKIDDVENILKYLSPEEMLIVDLKFFRRSRWKTIAWSYSKKFEAREERTLRHILNNAITRIEIKLGIRKVEACR